jgi:hypothetical protein
VSPPGARQRTSLGSLGIHTALVYYADREVSFQKATEEVRRFLDASEPRLAVVPGSNVGAAIQSVSPSPTILASGRLRNVRLSDLRDGRFIRGSDDAVLVGNAAAIDAWKP